MFFGLTVLTPTTVIFLKWVQKIILFKAERSSIIPLLVEFFGTEKRGPWNLRVLVSFIVLASSIEGTKLSSIGINS